jgi:hypothetical protein
MSESPEDVVKILLHVAATIGHPDNWDKWPGGWPGDIEAALVDAVYSARAVYRSKRGRGIYADVADWRHSRARRSYSLDALIEEIDTVGVVTWAHKFGNLQVSPHRPASAPCGRSKAATLRQAACVLRDHGVNTADQIDLSNAESARLALCSVPGIGYATSNYFLMLLGAPGVKPDRMIHRFLLEAAEHSFTNREADRAIHAAAENLGVQPHQLDHAIWRFESGNSAQRRGRHAEG